MYFLIAAILSVNFFIITKKLYNYCRHNHLLSKIDLCDCTDCYQKLIDNNSDTEEDTEEEETEEEDTEEDNTEEDNTEEDNTKEDNTEEDIDTLDTDETNEDTNICNVVVDNDNDNDNILQNKKDV
jgi:hypothetical protein